MSQAPPPVAPLNPGKKPDARALLAELAGPDYEAKHPGVLDRLAALMNAEAMSYEFEAGAVAYLGKDLSPAQRVDLWMKAADAFPDNPVVADVMIRAAFQEGGSKAEAALAAQLVRTPKDAHLLWLQSSLAFEGGHPEEALGFLESARGMPAWKDLGGLAELGALRVLSAMGEAQDLFQRFNTLVRYPRPELSRFSGLADQASDWAGQCRDQGRPQDGLRALEAVERVGASLETGSRSLVGFISAQNTREEALRGMAAQAEVSGDVALSTRVQESLRQVEAERQKFWAWDKEYRRKSAERLKPAYERLGLPFNAASALHNVGGFQSREAELLPEERRMLEEAGTALFEEMDAYRKAGP